MQAIARVPCAGSWRGANIRGVAGAQAKTSPYVSALRLARPRCMSVLNAVQSREDEAATSSGRPKSEAEATTEKYGLEAGLYKTLTSKPTEGGISRTEQAKQLLAQYGSAYLITSISFAAVSFAACYAAVNAGLDVGALLSKIGLQPSDTSETVGTFAIAYAAHKALSPVRFPPTVALTPVVAKWLGSKGVGVGKDGGEQKQ